MKKDISNPFLCCLGLISCNKTEATTETSTSTETVAGGQEAVVDEDSAPTIVKLAAGNKDLFYPCYRSRSRLDSLLH